MTGISIDFPNDENGDVLRRMQQGGDDFTKARDVDFSVVYRMKGQLKSLQIVSGKLALEFPLKSGTVMEKCCGM